MNANRPFIRAQLAICAACLLMGVRVWAQAPAGSADGAARVEGQRIAAIRILSESGELIRENPPDLPLQPGQPLTSEFVRECLRKLYRTGDYSDLRAETAEVAGGVRLDFVVRKNFYINQVHVTGLHDPPSENLAVAAMHVGLGEAFREVNLNEALGRLREVLQQEGLYQAQLSPQLTPHPETQEMDIVVNVNTGVRARIGAITFGNQSAFTNAEILREAKLKQGQELTSSRLTHATDRVRKFLVKKGHLGASATIHRGEFDAKTTVVPLTFDVVGGPAVRVEVAGAKIPTKDIRKLVPVYEEGSVDADLLAEGRRNIRDYLERKGYFDAQVEYTLSTPSGAEEKGKPADQVIRYQVDRGVRKRLAGISVDGNKYFSSELLRGRLAIQSAAFASPGRFSRRLLDDDTTSMSTIYAANGFVGVKVRSEVIEDYHGKKGESFVKFHVEEGTQTLVGELELQGNREISDETLKGVIGSTVGQPYSDFDISGDRDNILTLYFNEGFPEAQFAATVEDMPPAPRVPGAALTPRVKLIYRITEGTQVHIARILTGGYEHTRAGVINRELRFHNGEPLREGEVIESQRRLYNLGVFSRVSVAPQNPTGTDPEKTMVVLVEEAKRYTISYGFGFEAQSIGGAAPASGVFEASPRGIFEFSKANLTGRADTLSFKVRASTLQYRALLGYTANNYFGNPKLGLQITGFVDKTRDVNTFTSTRNEGSVQLSEKITLNTSLLFRYAFRRVLVDPASLRIAPQEIPLFSQPTLVSEVGATWLRERRDNPADATHGDFNNADFSVAMKALGSSANFTRVFLQNSSYHPFGRSFVFARSARFGWQRTFGGSVATDIPLPERFFAGGGTTLRGFGLNQAGPRDPQTGFPIGGLSMIILNQELRFPMHLPLVGTRLGGAVFYDAGNVFSSAGRITLRWAPTQFSIDSGDLAYLAHTIGFGFRYATPIGPVRVDLSYQLNPALFTFLNSANVPQTARLPHFQFFFSLGSNF
jgi:outer membrane protein insertion porin family